MQTDTVHTTQQTALRQTGFRPDIEGLRAIAVLIVVAFHAGIPGFRGGFIGVDVFFVLSGYLITGLLVNEAERTGRISFSRFYARRARRLLPASFVVLCTTLIVGMAVFSPVEMARFSSAAAAAAGYSSNFYFIHKAADYFAARVEINPFLHTWSLAVEEQFYLIWPLLIVLALRVRSSRRMLVLVLSSVTALSFAGCIWLTHSDQPWAFFGTPARAWEFGLGGLAVLWPETKRMKGHRLPGWVGLAGILGAASLFSPRMSFPGAAAMVPVLATAVVLVVGASAEPVGGATVMLHERVFQYFGALSYSWYLWHWPTIVIGRTLFPKLSIGESALLMVGSLGLAALAHSTVENPIRFSRYLSARSRMSLGIAGLLTAAGLCVTVAVRQSSLRAARSPEQAQFLDAERENVSTAHTCIAWPGQTRVKQCSFGREDSVHKVVLFGDSHAEQWIPALSRIAGKREWHLITMLKSSCPGARVTIFNPGLNREETECTIWREQALERIVALHPSAVLMQNATGYVKRGDEGNGYGTLSVREWAKGVRSTLKFLNDAGVHTILMRDTPRPNFDVPTCLSRVAQHGRWYPAGSCAAESRTALNAELWRAEEVSAKGLRYVSTLDLSDQFCANGSCVPMRDGLVIYRDTNHLTSRFVSKLTPVVASRLAPLLSF